MREGILAPAVEGILAPAVEGILALAVSLAPAARVARRTASVGVVLWLMLVVATGSTVLAQERQAPVKIGVLAKRGAERCLEKWGPTAEYLTDQIPGRSFVIVPLGFDEIYPTVEQGDVDFVLANPSLYVELEQLYGVNRVATLNNRVLREAYTIYGGVIFRRAERDDIKSLADLKGKTFMAAKETSFGGWRMAWRELKEAGIDPHRDFAELRFGGTHDAVVYAVRDGAVDAGTVRTDTLERMVAEGKICLGDFRVICERAANTDELPFLHSTRLYPEWPFAEIKHIPDELAQKVTVALLSMPAESPAAKATRCAGWTVPLNYQPVHECFKELRIGPYKDFGKVTLSAAVRQYWPWLLAAVVFLALAAITTLYVLRLNRVQHQLRLTVERELADRKRAQDELRKTAGLLQSIMDSATEEIIIATDPKGIILSWNEGARRLLGYEPEEVVGKESVRIFHTKWYLKSGRMDANIKNMMTTGKPLVEETTYVAKGGKAFPVQQIMTPRFGEDGELLGMLGLIRDITDRKRAEAELRPTSQYARRLIEASLDPLVTISPEGKVTDVNEATEAVTGVARAQLIGSDFSEYFTKPDKAREGYRQVFSEGTVTDYPLTIRHASGRLTDVLYNAAVYKDESGEVQGVFAAARDITEQKAAEAQVREASQYTRSLIEASLDPLVTISPEGKITDVNEATEAVTGVAREQLIGSDFSDYFTEPDKAREGYQRVFSQGRVTDYPLTIRHASGHLTDVLYNAAVYKDESGEVQGVFAAARDITEQKAAEARVREASQYMRRLIEASLDPLVTISPEGKITDVNEATEAVTGVARAQLIGSDFSEYFTKPDKAREGYQQVFSQGTVTDYPLTIRHASGRLTDVLYNAAVYKDESGEVQGVFAAARDVTERKRTEQKLEQLRRQHELVLNSAAEGVYGLDRKGNTTLVNPAAARMLGWKAGELMGRPHHGCVHHSKADGTPYPGEECPIQATLEDGISHHSSDEVFWKKDGTAFPVEFRSTPIEEQGEVTGAVITFQDISEKKRAEQQLRESEEHHRAITESAQDAVIASDAEGNIQFWNPAAENIFGFSAAEAVGRNMMEIIVPPQYHEAKQKGLAVFGRTGSGAAIGKTLELTALRKDGSEFPIEISLSGYRDRGGFVAVALVRDITERKEADEELHESNVMVVDALQRERRAAMELESAMQQLEAANQVAEAANLAKSEFLANMSHEIRTPMTAILGFSENLLDSDLTQSDRLNAIHTIHRNGEYLLGIINDILDLSKIEAGKMSVERIACSPCQIVAEVASLVQVRAQAKGLPFNIEYIGAIPETIQTDPTRLRQILINLIGNAIKFTEVGGARLVVRLATGDYGLPILQFDVVDTGVGMSAEQIAKLFQPFAQADTSTTRKFGGTGLGLTISKRFAEMLGGDITFDSKPGEGSTFRVTIATGPLEGMTMLQDPMSATVIATDISKATADTSQAQLEGCRILLAEDGPDNQRLISFVLKKAGAEVTVVENGKLAANAALAARDEGNPFDVILMDMQMPVVDGYEATGLLRQKDYTGPIIALTAHAMEGDREKCIRAGCNDYAAKPINRVALVRVVAKWVEKARQESELQAAGTTI